MVSAAGGAESPQPMVPTSIAAKVHMTTEARIDSCPETALTQENPKPTTFNRVTQNLDRSWKIEGCPRKDRLTGQSSVTKHLQLQFSVRIEGDRELDRPPASNLDRLLGNLRPLVPCMQCVLARRHTVDRKRTGN